MTLTQNQRNVIRATLKARGYTLSGYARARNFNSNTFRMWLRGTWGAANRGKVSTAYHQAVIGDGLLNDMQ